MSGYLQGEALLDACRAGLGKIVIVEGESPELEQLVRRIREQP